MEVLYLSHLFLKRFTKSSVLVRRSKEHMLWSIGRRMITFWRSILLLNHHIGTTADI